MAAAVYAVPGLVLGLSSTFSSQVQQLQRDLRALGYITGPLDGVFGKGTQNAVKALQYDLMHNDGASSQNDGSAPVAVRNYNNGSVTALTGVVDQGLVSCIAAMLADPAYPKLPFSPNPAQDNQTALAAAQSMSGQVPNKFLLAILLQESRWQHFQVPGSSNVDNFVTVGLDHNNQQTPAAITSRGYGIGQVTLFHHPPTATEVATIIGDPVANITRTVSILLGKFQHFVNGSGPGEQATDRIQEAGAGTLRWCQFPASDPRYMKVCGTCFEQAATTNITAGVTPVYAGISETYTQTHEGVPVRSKIPCDWPYAIRRYNGGGAASYDYQADVLLKALKGQS